MLFQRSSLRKIRNSLKRSASSAKFRLRTVRSSEQPHCFDASSWRETQANLFPRDRDLTRRRSVSKFIGLLDIFSSRLYLSLKIVYFDNIFLVQLRSVSALRLSLFIIIGWHLARRSDKKFQNHQPDSLYFLCFVTAGDQTRAQRGTLLESSSESRSAPFISSLKVISTKACQPFSFSPSPYLYQSERSFFGGGGKSCTKDSFTWPGAVKIGETLSA